MRTVGKAFSGFLSENQKADSLQCIGIEICLLDILEIPVRGHLQLIACRFIADDDRAWMHLDRGARPCLRYTALDSMLESCCLVMAIDEYHDLPGIHDCLDADSKRGRRHACYIPSEET